MTISLIFCLIVVAILVGCVILLVRTVKRMQSEREFLEDRIEQMTIMNNKLRAGRHDYLNNMQIVYGMVELGEYDELYEFLKPMYKDVMKTGKALKTSIPAVNALLMAKMEEAEGAGIDFFVEVKSNLSGTAISDWDLCRILSNLIDNAIRAVSEIDGGKKITVDISEDRGSYIFRIIDNGVKISDSDKDKIFNPGFTTKKSEGHGMGLYIVSKLVAKNGGTVSLTSNRDEKCFEFTISKKGESMWK